MYTTLLAFVLLPSGSIVAPYAAIFLFLAVTGVGIPIPEEVTLFLAGYLAHIGITHLLPMIIVTAAGLIAADIIGYQVGKYAGDWIYRRIISKSTYLMALAEKTEKYFEKYGERVILHTRPLPSIRSLAPIFAGHFKVNFERFIRYDILVSIPWAALFVLVSYSLGTGIDLITKAKEIKHTLYSIIALAFITHSAIRLMT